jgi:chromosome partitioning protein
VHTVCLCNRKGGVGKSTISCNLAVEASLNKQKVLLIDSDLQGSSVSFRGMREKEDIQAVSIVTSTIHTDVKQFNNFDFIVIDVGGRDSKAFRSAIVASNLVIIPVLPSQLDVWGTVDTIEILREARSVRKDIKAYFVLNQVIPNTKIEKEAIEALEKFKEEVPLLKTILYARIDFKHSMGKGIGVTEYKSNSKASEEIKKLYKEIKSNLKG